MTDDGFAVDWDAPPGKRIRWSATEPPPRVGVPDTGDVIDPNTDDPTPDEITDPNHPDYVEPWDGH
jgi:hypothetical protein